MSSKCRICQATAATAIGEVEYFSGYRWMIYDCDACGCRFTNHDDTVYEQFHFTGALAYYSDYRKLAAESKRLFEQKDMDGLRSLLSSWSKYRFIINEISSAPRGANVLECGCSRGYLTSWLILDGRNVLGVDVSREAIDSAKNTFGNYFDLANSSEVYKRAPYDVIYHVGMIGCVANPLELTNELLGILKPGGRLLFNAPNRQSCSLRGQLWIDEAPPPDLVTMFPPGFWNQHFAISADVSEHIEMHPANRSVEIGLRKVFCHQWKKPVAVPLAEISSLLESPSPISKILWRYFERAVLKGFRIAGLEHFAPLQPSNFGLFIKMTRK